jgi:3-deoxy-D-manno-octulosonic-acid transferase
MTRFFYSLVVWLAQPFLRRKLLKRGQQESGYLEAVDERFGYYTAAPNLVKDGLVWVHAVSLGETRTAAVLVARLRERLPGMRLLLTHGTATGRAEGAKLLRAGDLQSWQPWDTPGAVDRFLTHFKPRIGILMETEIWPNLVAACQRRHVPLVLANARMSDKSQRQSQRLACLSRPAFAALTAVWAQTDADAQRLKQLGATVQGVFGNLKFDAAPNAAQVAIGRAWRQQAERPVLMFASSREGEEAALLKVLATSLTSTYGLPLVTRHEAGAQASSFATATDVQWLIVPRHPQRFDEVAALMAQHGFAVSRRSTWLDGPPGTRHSDLSAELEAGAAAIPAAGHDTRPVIWLGDSLGEMALYYGLADVALLGGSFEPLGGQNLIEAAACACPVVMGPHTFNFAEAAELAVLAGAAQRVSDLSQAVEVAQTLVSNPAVHTAMVSAAAEFSSAHRGAVDKTASAVLALLK